MAARISQFVSPVQYPHPNRWIDLGVAADAGFCALASTVDQVLAIDAWGNQIFHWTGPLFTASGAEGAEGAEGLFPPKYVIDLASGWPRANLRGVVLPNAAENLLIVDPDRPPQLWSDGVQWTLSDPVGGRVLLLKALHSEAGDDPARQAIGAQVIVGPPHERPGPWRSIERHRRRDPVPGHPRARRNSDVCPLAALGKRPIGCDRQQIRLTSTVLPPRTARPFPGNQGRPLGSR